MSEHEYQESYHFIISHPEAVARQMTHLIVGKRELEVRVKQLEAALQWINMQRYTDRSTITPDNAFERAVSLNDQLVMIMDKARAALAPSQEPVCDTHHPPQASEMMEPHIDVAEYDKTRWD